MGGVGNFHTHDSPETVNISTQHAPLFLATLSTTWRQESSMAQQSTPHPTTTTTHTHTHSHTHTHTRTHTSTYTRTRPKLNSPRHTRTPQHTTLKHTAPHHTTPHHTTPHHTTPRHTTPHRTNTLTKHTWHNLCFALFSPLCNFSVDLLSHF